VFFCCFEQARPPDRRPRRAAAGAEEQAAGKGVCPRLPRFLDQSAMQKPLLLLAALLAGLSLAAAPAVAQKPDKDKLIENSDPSNPDNAELADAIMRRTLPFKEAQTLKYFTGDGRFDGYAVRRHHTIRFYDPDGTLIGRAERVTQQLTNYYAPDGAFLGRRVSQKMTMASTARSSEGKGFINLYELKRPTEAGGQ